MEAKQLNTRTLSGPNKLMTATAAINGFLAVALGAFAAHGLHSYASADLLPTWHTGVRYHMFHALAALIAGMFAQICGTDHASGRWSVLAVWLFISGILFFCGSLYLLVLAPQGWLMMTAPVGGVLLLLGWVSLIWSLISSK